MYFPTFPTNKNRCFRLALPAAEDHTLRKLMQEIRFELVERVEDTDSPSEATLRNSLATQGVVLTQLVGHATTTLSESGLLGFQRALTEAKEPSWLIDLSELTGFDSMAAVVGRQWFASFRNAGGTKVALISSLPAARMAVATLSFATAVTFLPFDDLPSALEHLTGREH